MMEGIGQDLKSGHIPDLFTEHGGHSELKYNKAGLLKKAATGLAIATLIIVFCKIRSREN